MARISSKWINPPSVYDETIRRNQRISSKTKSVQSIFMLLVFFCFRNCATSQRLHGINQSEKEHASVFIPISIGMGDGFVRSGCETGERELFPQVRTTSDHFSALQKCGKSLRLGTTLPPATPPGLSAKLLIANCTKQYRCIGQS